MVHGKLILHFPSDSRVFWMGTKLCKYLSLSFFVSLQEIQNVSYHETVIHHSNSLEETMWRLSGSVLWLPKRMAKTSDFFFVFCKMNTCPLAPNHSITEACISIGTDWKDWKLSIFTDWVRYFCISKDLLLILQVQIKVSIKLYGL